MRPQLTSLRAALHPKEWRRLPARAWSAWRLEPWPLKAWNEQGRAYKVFTIAMYVLFISLATAALAVAGPVTANEQFGVLVIAITLALDMRRHRISDGTEYPFSTIAAAALTLNGMLIEALIISTASALIAYSRRGLPLHLLIWNITYYAGLWGSMVLATSVFGSTSTLELPLEWSAPVQWLAALVAYLVVNCTLQVHYALGGFIPGFAAAAKEWIQTDFRESLLGILPLSILLGAFLAPRNTVAALGVLFAFAVITDMYGRIEDALVAQEQRESLRQSFSGYVPESIAAQLAEADTPVELGGKLEQITVLFCDIRGFTAWAERTPATQVVAHLNSLLDALSSCVFENAGTLDKFTGDGLMAFWGAPVHSDTHADDALRAAIAMRTVLHERNESVRHDGVPRFAIGIGIATGSAVVGNIGSLRRHDYTAIGDTVNIAARVEGATKDLGVDMLLHESTAMLVSDALQAGLAEAGAVALKGKERAQRVFTHVEFPAEIATNRTVA